MDQRRGADRCSASLGILEELGPLGIVIGNMVCHAFGPALVFPGEASFKLEQVVGALFGNHPF